MLFIELLKAIFFGIVEGITEWLPISSTGHLILVQEFITLKQNASYMEMFDVVIQLGAILAVIVVYFARLNPFQPGKTAKEVRLTWQLWAKVVVAIIPVVLVGLKFNDWFNNHFYNVITVALMLIIYGLAFIWIEKRHRHMTPQITTLAQMPYKTAFLIGLFQVLSIIPGTSRSGATILGGILVGTSRTVATEFTFFLGIPVMFGASLLKVVKYFAAGHGFTMSQSLILLVASLTAFVVSLYAIKFLTDYVKRHDFTIFGKYRIVLGSLLLIYYVITHLR
ncbi:MAG: undecaprenyl-diphosphatase [Streptococcus pyogenes]|uniref:undecaprenyl-diphosphate phosphatase n=1 Tax=Streptococcus halichoeri TaxID=254785 RepID=UPI000DB4268A|nr:undecaprenyl-diphosphate phosphatase [Streptococcus halichoeri]PZO94579.1 MAG: undecaprenyl-diphosphatase [Streptococcus pyogenes]